MAQHTPFPHARTLPEGEANRSTSWVAASPHLSADPCPASGAHNTDTALFPFCIQPMCREGWRESSNKAEEATVAMSGTFSKPKWWWGVGAFWRWTRGYTELGSQTLQAKKKEKKRKKPLYEEIQVTASCSCALILFSATTGRWSVIFLLV